jgi:hypothetical protein
MSVHEDFVVVAVMFENWNICSCMDICCTSGLPVTFPCATIDNQLGDILTVGPLRPVSLLSPITSMSLLTSPQSGLQGEKKSYFRRTMAFYRIKEGRMEFLCMRCIKHIHYPRLGPTLINYMLPQRRRQMM